MGDEKMRVTLHNGRTGKKGRTYRARHNDERDGKPEKLKEVLYKRCVYSNMSFEDAEKHFYETHFQKHLDAVNERYIKQRKKSKVKSMDEYRKSPRTSPEETIWCIGDRDNSTATKDDLLKLFQQQIEWEHQQFPEVKYLDYALHKEEGVFHIHSRRVWVACDKDGNSEVNEGAVLRKHNIERPDLNKACKIDNNPKMTYTAMCREHWQELVRAYGFDIETNPRPKGESGHSLEVYKQKKAMEKEVEGLQKERDRLKRSVANNKAALGSLQQQREDVQKQITRKMKQGNKLLRDLVDNLDVMAELQEFRADMTISQEELDSFHAMQRELMPTRAPETPIEDDKQEQAMDMPLRTRRTPVEDDKRAQGTDTPENDKNTPKTTPKDKKSAYDIIRILQEFDEKQEEQSKDDRELE